MKSENVIQKKSYFFALEILGLVRKFPKNTEGFIIGKQLRRSAISMEQMWKKQLVGNRIKTSWQK